MSCSTYYFVIDIHDLDSLLPKTNAHIYATHNPAHVQAHPRVPARVRAGAQTYIQLHITANI